jgi:phosphoribosylamine--glycine ligase
MKILVIGSGGREHALAWKLKQDSRNPEIFVAPGNGGTSLFCTNLAITAEDLASLLAWAKENKPDLTVVGPEAPLCAGITDLFQAAGLRVFGPCQAGARLEGSKQFSKEVMEAAGVPTAKAATFTEAAAAKEYVRKQGAPIVVKADGLAAGKGVTVAMTIADAEAAIDEALVSRAFGDAGNTVLVEEFLAGEEASILALLDGEHVVLLASSQDHKRVGDGDTGPNTGGMGAYSPAPVVTDDLLPFIREEVFGRMLRELKRRGITYKGLLYAGLMMTKAGPKVLEFNCRFGDPETQAVLMRWEGDMIPALEACIDGTLTETLVRWRPEPSVCVVIAAGGYPGDYVKNEPMFGIGVANEVPGVVVFHAGTKQHLGGFFTTGGRVLGVTAIGADLATAVKQAYIAARKIEFRGLQYRTDIAWRALQRGRK